MLRLFLLITLCFSGFIVQGQTLISVIAHYGPIRVIHQDGATQDISTSESLTLREADYVELGENSELHVQRGERLLTLLGPGRYELETEFNKRSVFFSKILLFLKRISSPRQMVASNFPRGEQLPSDLDNTTLFNNTWNTLIQVQEADAKDIAPNKLLATAAWYEQQQMPVRVAWLLERLRQTDPANPTFERLRHEAWERVTPEQVDNEVAESLRRIRQQLPQLRNMAILIGINEYDAPEWQPLKNPINDVTAIRKVLIRHYQFRPEDILLLKNPTQADIFGAFREMREKSDELTNLFVYYAGHGHFDYTANLGYWLPKDAGSLETEAQFINTNVILGKVMAIPSKHTLLMVDSCFSGDLVRQSRGQIPELYSLYFTELMQKKSRQIITSGDFDETVKDDGGGRKHSVFAKKFLDLLNKPRMAPLSASELAVEIRKAVKNEGESQTPHYARLKVDDEEGGEFFFIRQEERSVGETIAQIPQTRWWNFGLHSYRETIQHFDDQDRTVISRLFGTGLQLQETRKRAELEQGWRVNLGTYHEQEQQVADIQSQHSSMVGEFLSGALFVEYRFWEVLYVGLETRVQHSRYHDFLDHDLLDSTSLQLCIPFGFKFKQEIWRINPMANVCFLPFDLVNGSLYELDEAQVRKVTNEGSLTIGISIGLEE